MTQPDYLPVARALRELALSFVRSSPPSPLSRTAAGTLAVLDRLGPCRITDLAERESITQPAMTGLVQRMEAAGLVTRQADPADARASLIAVTAQGSDALTSRRHQQDALVAARLAHLQEDELARLRDAVPALIALTHLVESHDPI